MRSNLCLVRLAGLLLSTVLVDCCIPSVARAEDSPPGRHVLLLNSYHQGYIWSDNLVGGIRSAFDESDMDVELNIEYMDTKYHSLDEVIPNLLKLFQSKWVGHKFDVLICSDNHALDFLLKVRGDLFPDVPVVFCGVNNYDDSLIEGHDPITGVAEDLSQKETIELMLRLHPKTRNIAVVSDNTTTGLANMARLRKVMGDFKSVKFIELENLTTPKLLDGLRSLPADTLIFHNAFYRDSLGNEYTVEEITSLIARNCDLPIYSTWDFVVNRNVVGGVVISGRSQGRHAANMALRIMGGESAADIPVLRTSPNVPMFSYNQLERLGIGESDLPEGSIIKNRPFSFYETYRTLIWSVVGVFAMMLLGIIVLVANIIKRKRAEVALVASEARFRALVEQAGDAIYLHDYDGRLVDVNKEACRSLGYTRAELLTMSVSDVDLDFTLEDDGRLWRDLSEKGPVVVERILTRKDRSTFPVDLCLGSIELGDKTLILTMARDITDRKQAEEERQTLQSQIQHTQKLESLGVLAGGIAHDFNNLLVGILGNSDLALMELSDSSPAKGHIREVRVASKRAADLTNQMLAYSGKGRFVVRGINLSSLVEEMGALLRVSISKKTVVEYDLDDDPGVIEGDVSQVRQVAMNLITNASDAIGEKSGVLTIRTGSLEADRAYLTETFLDDNLPEGRYAFLEVQDTGDGMDADTQARLFDPFFTTKFTGRGLGLAAVLGIVRGHRGAIKLDSAPGKGTTFRVLFPCSDRIQDADDSPDDVQDEGLGRELIDAGQLVQRGNVLVIDDEETVRKLAEKVLQRIGFTVLTACDGRQGVALYAEHSDEIAVVLLDMTMPGLSGTEAFDRIREIRSDAKVILCSGYNQADAASCFVDQGLAGFLHKPFRVNELVARIMSACES
ncbi:MAG: ABC transporter substrate binding protein [Phycisphaerae bacterium]|jgi:PAS domain S-box-containing protein|nr:ABC transporter substrate binding protein [Phycisphaerae bacterium]